MESLPSFGELAPISFGMRNWDTIEFEQPGRVPDKNRTMMAAHPLLPGNDTITKR
jgi:hypothetical protein